MEQNEKNKNSVDWEKSRKSKRKKQSTVGPSWPNRVSQSFLKSIMWFGRTGDCWLQRVNIMYT